MRSLPLEPEHLRLGARFSETGALRLPADYGDSEGEQRAIRAAAGVIDWSGRGKIRVTGPDRVSFLDGLLTNDVKTLADGRGMHAATLDHRGHVHGDLVVYHREDEFLLETVGEDDGSLLAHLNKLLVSDDVSLGDVTGEWALLGLFGPRSGEITANVLGQPLPMDGYAHRTVNRGGTEAFVARSPYFGGDGFELWTPASQGGSILRSLVDAGARPVGGTAAEALRIEAGRPLFGVDMDASTVVLESRLEDAISLTKGCYVGQEIVSRATYIGHVNRVLVGFDFGALEPPLETTEVLRDGKAVGRVTSAARSASLGRTIGLGYVRREFAEPGTEVRVNARGEGGARVASLPFLRP